MNLSDLRPSEEVLTGALRDPTFRAEWERTAGRARPCFAGGRVSSQARSVTASAGRQLPACRSPGGRLEAAIHNPEIETLRRVASVLDVAVRPEDPATAGTDALSSSFKHEGRVAP